MAVEDGPVVPGLRRLFEPLTIGTFTVRNRIVNTTHGTALGEARDLRYLQERARGGAALLGVHASTGIYSYAIGAGPRSAAPDWDGLALSPVSPEGIAQYDDVVIPWMRRRADIVHAEGAACFAQVYHPGAGRHGASAGPTLAPSAVQDPYEAYMPHPLRDEEIEELVWAFAHGIRRAQEGGMDAAEIHAAHGYLVNEFFSPYFNRRDDRWGGNRANRVRFALAIIEAARTMVGPDFPIGIRVGVDGDGQHRGLSVEELAEVCRILGPHVAYVSVSGGSYAGFGDGMELAYVSPWYKEPGFNVGAAAAVKAAVDVPVIVTGRIADVALAESILADGAADLIGMVRALIADPDLPNKAKEGRVEEIRMCIGMSECHAIGPHRVPMTCAVNAAAAREAEMEITPAEVTKTVVVVGAGPAGMEAARVAALRGHHVYLADTRRSIGGTPAVLALDDNRRNLRDHAAYFQTQLRRLGVELMLGNEVTADELVEFAPDAVIVATGGQPLVPDVPGIEGPNVVHALDVLRGAATAPRVVVVGGLDKHLGPPTIAEHLADQGKDVELISEQFDFAQGVEDGTRLPLFQRLRTKHVAVSMLHKLTCVDEHTVVVTDTFTKQDRRIDDASVVLACGLVPDDRLARALEGRIPEVHVVGDALAPRRMMHATLEGARAAMAI
ncbi:MAG TPA: FAD-dependent oxidoreductase [Acidimicrobiales bacterium]|jgi:2,4-dienoyl-CoA reductase-like NADH-dependent reductase (Old Yellow Enzyme family)/thioredoxin reductase|nr:FAD-dependent oxidoreductase [Acidimicrobiales bacterium]